MLKKFCFFFFPAPYFSDEPTMVVILALETDTLIVLGHGELIQVQSNSWVIHEHFKHPKRSKLDFLAFSLIFRGSQMEALGLAFQIFLFGWFEFGVVVMVLVRTKL